MTETPAPDAAVQIALEALGESVGGAFVRQWFAQIMLNALARAGWLHDPTEVERLRDMIDAAHGIICNAHRKRVDDVTNEDGASPGWAEAARRWIDAYPPATRALHP